MRNRLAKGAGQALVSGAHGRSPRRARRPIERPGPSACIPSLADRNAIHDCAVLLLRGGSLPRRWRWRGSVHGRGRRRRSAHGRGWRRRRMRRRRRYFSNMVLRPSRRPRRGIDRRRMAERWILLARRRRQGLVWADSFPRRRTDVPRGGGRSAMKRRRANRRFAPPVLAERLGPR